MKKLTVLAVVALLTACGDDNSGSSNSKKYDVVVDDWSVDAIYHEAELESLSPARGKYDLTNTPNVSVVGEISVDEVYGDSYTTSCKSKVLIQADSPVEIEVLGPTLGIFYFNNGTVMEIEYEAQEHNMSGCSLVISNTNGDVTAYSMSVAQSF